MSFVDANRRCPQMVLPSHSPAQRHVRPVEADISSRKARSEVDPELSRKSLLPARAAWYRSSHQAALVEHREGHMPVNTGRRELIATLGSVVAWPLTAQRMPVVGFLGPG